jgi:aspartate-semialdehyde dehydrogenase|tara:strand:- start:10311 stop:10682 length:372 start_codon:yes stop_codon:yes gene_type:complete
MELDGLGETTERIRDIGRKIEKDTARILNEVGQPKIAKMKSRTPVRDGHLRASVHLVPAKRSGQGVEVKWAAGGVAVDYALQQHEDLSYKHTTGQSKYIISVVYEDAKDMRSAIASEIKKMFT